MKKVMKNIFSISFVNMHSVGLLSTVVVQSIVLNQLGITVLRSKNIIIKVTQKLPLLS
jgi:hypothetical protein